MQRPAAPCTVSSGRRRRSAEGDQMGQQGKAMAGMAESTLCWRCASRGSKTLGGDMRVLPREGRLHSMTPRYFSALRILVQRQRSSCKFWQTETTGRLGGLTVI